MRMEHQTNIHDSAVGTFKVTLSMKKEPNGGPVYCKMDGQRFKQPKTVKLHTDTTYRIDVSFKPPRCLESMVILGREMAACERSRDSTASAYSSYYNTQGILPSKKGHREDMPIIMKVRETGELSTCLQIKFYRQQDVQHCEWGSRLHCIELDCSACEGSLSVTEGGECLTDSLLKSFPIYFSHSPHNGATVEQPKTPPGSPSQEEDSSDLQQDRESLIST